MDRRDFIKLSAGVAGGMALLPAGAMSVTPDIDAPCNQRLVFEMDRNWRYVWQCVENLAKSDFDDSLFEQVVLPHRGNSKLVNVCPNFTYRRSFRLPTAARGRRVLIDLDGDVSGHLTAWMNGQCVSKGGDSPFPSSCTYPYSFDVTPHVDWMGENVFVVEMATSAALLRYFRFGLAVDHVAIRLMPPTYVEILDRPRIVNISNFWARVCRMGILNVRLFVGGRNLSSSGLALDAELRSCNQVIATASKTLDCANVTAGSRLVELQLKIHGFDEFLSFIYNPHQYTVVARLSGGGAIIDEDRWLMDLPVRPTTMAGSII